MDLFGVLACPLLQRELMYFVYANEQVVLFCSCSFLYLDRRQDIIDIKHSYLTLQDYLFHQWLAEGIRRDIEREAREYNMRREYRMLVDSGSDNESSTDS